MITLKINPEKIRDVIGKGGAVIRALTEETGTAIDIEDDGTVTIALRQHAKPARIAKKPHRRHHRRSRSGPDLRRHRAAHARLRRHRFRCCPARMVCCISPRSPTSASMRSADYLKEGQVVNVKVIETDDKGRVRLSMKA